MKPNSHIFNPFKFQHSLLLLLLIGLVTSGCQSYEKELITPENIEKNTEKIVRDAQTTESEKIFFETLLFLHKGRKEFVKWIYELSGKQGDYSTYDHYIANESDFEHIATSIYKLIQDNRLTYGNVLKQIRQANEIASQYGEKLIKVHEEIDRICTEINAEGKHSFQYQPTDPLNGYCPFIEDSHPLYKEATQIQEERDTEISQKFVLLTQLRKLESNLYQRL